MLNDQEIIDKFHQRISYVAECKIIELDGFTLTSTQYILYMPCNWQDYEERKQKIIALAEKANYAPGIIIAGEPDKQALSTILHDPSLPEKMLFKGKTMQFQMQTEFIDPKVREYLNRTTLWDFKEPY